MDRSAMEGFIGKRRKRRKRYGEYTAGRAHRAAAAAVAGERPPYHLTYSRRAAAGTLHGQGNPAGKEAEGRKVLVVPLHGNVEVNGIRIDIGEPEGQA